MESPESPKMKGVKNKHGMKRAIIFIASCLLAFALFITMLADFILVSFSVSPIFSRIASTVYEETNYGTVIEGHGILYSTITAKEEFANGYFAAYKFFPGFKKWDEDMQIETSFYRTEKDPEIVPPPENGEDSDFDYDYEEDIILDAYILNMDAVRDLAFSNISPFEFMERFPGTLTEDSPATYFVALPNDYAVRIEYSGDTVNYIHLEDHRLGMLLDLQAQSSDIDAFLLERNQ